MQESATRDQPEQTIDNRLAYGFSAAAVLLRLIPGIANFSPVGALCLFGGARMRSWRAYVLPTAVMVVSDIGLRLMNPAKTPFDPFVYGSFLLSVLIGRALARTKSPLWIAGAAIVSSFQFYLITNFGCWLTMTDYYARSLSGLVDCYVAAIPFYLKGTLPGDLAFSGLFFGLSALAAYVTRTATAKEVA